MPPSLRARLLQPPVIIGGSIAVAAVAIVITLVITNPRTSGSYVNPVQGPITEEVDAPGLVQAADSVDLSFERSGRIVSVPATVGAHVAAGVLLAAIDGTELKASLEQAQAALQVQQAKLDSLNTGARPEDIAVAQTAVDGAQATLAQDTQNLASAAQNAYVVSDDAIRNRVDQFLNNPRTSSPSLVFTLSDSQLQASIPADRVGLETLLFSWQTAQAALPSPPDGAAASAAASQAQDSLSRISAYLDEVASGLTKVVPTSSYPPSTVSTYQASIAVARGNIAAAVAALNTAQTAETAARSALASAQSALARTKAPATSQDVTAQTAQVAAAQANVDAALAELSKTSLRAPFSGTVTVQNAHLGQLAVPGTPLISMISDAQFQFVVYVSEADLPKVKVGNEAQVALDAYQGAAPLSAKVIAVDPAATMQQGVASYKVTLEFEGADPRVQAGLSGNVRIITQTKQSTLTVPSSAIITQSTGTYVLRASGSGDELVPVHIGIASASGRTEILSGISASDRIRQFGNQQ